MLLLRRPQSVLFCLVVTALLVVACASPEPADRETSDEPPLFVYVSPESLGINPFLIMGQTGLEQAAERHGARTMVFESEDPTTRDENVRAAIAEGASLVLVLGFEFLDVLREVAPLAPDVEFLIIDHCVDSPLPNVHCVMFKEYEAAFLIGAAAASLSSTGHVGAIGAVDTPFLHRYTEGFALGARHVDPEIQVSTLWVGGESPFADPVRAKEQALAMAAQGADHILTAAAAGNFGVFEAARERGFAAFGIDVNQCPSAPDVVVENMIKKVDRVVVEAVDTILKNRQRVSESVGSEPVGYVPQLFEYGLAEGGVGLVTLTSKDPATSQCRILDHPEVLDRLRDIERQIIDGEIKIRDPALSSILDDIGLVSSPPLRPPRSD